MKKKDRRESKAVWYTLLVLSIVILFWAFFAYPNKFNPETDVCDKTVDMEVTGGHFSQETVYDLSDGDLKQFEKNYNNKFDTNTLHNCRWGDMWREKVAFCDYCVDDKWHPKSKCELNPNDEGCVCDEYPTITKKCFVNATFIIFTKYGNFTFESHTENVDKTCIEYWGDTLLLDYPYKILETNWRNYTYVPDSSDCIKAHEANECEKSNPNYVLDEEIHQGVDAFGDEGVSFHCSDFPYDWDNQTLYDKWCVKKVNICREKTLTDLSCAELLDYYENGNECLKLKYHSGEWVIVNPCVQWKYPVWYDDKQILSEYLRSC